MHSASGWQKRVCNFYAFKRLEEGMVVQTHSTSGYGSKKSNTRFNTYQITNVIV